MAADRAEMVKALAITLAIESDGALQAQLRKLARTSDGWPFMPLPVSISAFGSSPLKSPDIPLDSLDDS